MNTVAAVLEAARRKLPPSEARLLLGHVLNKSAAWLLAHGEQVLDEDDLLAFASLVARRAGGEPVAYLVGRREFFGRGAGKGNALVGTGRIASGATLISKPAWRAKSIT